jgi:glycosyltransferase involved in cell wall biosynthesis
MISVIVCSVNKDSRPAFAEQVRQTIGAPYELIIVENDLDKLSICAAYNKGASAAKYPFLCFVHEDVTFHTPGWGAAFVNALQSNGVGFLGLAGATLKTRNPSPWWITHCNPLADKYRKVHFIQSGVGQLQSSQSKDSLQEVLCLDGFLLACRSDIWLSIHFDEKTLTDFHFYDVDICLAANRKGFKNYVFTQCSIEHHSTGSINTGWIRSAESFQKKWAALLPLSIGPVLPEDRKELERLALLDYINALISNDFLFLSLKYLARLITYRATPDSNQVFKRYLKCLLHLQSGKSLKTA